MGRVQQIKDPKVQGAHAARVRRVIKAYDEGVLEELDVEYDQGEAWLGSTQYSLLVPERRGDEGILRLGFESDAWVDAQAISDLLKVPRDKIVQEYEA